MKSRDSRYGETKDATTLTPGLAIDAVAGGDIPLHRGPEAGIHVGATVRHPAELEGAARLDPASHRNGPEVVLELGRRVGEALHHGERRAGSGGGRIDA